MKISELIKQLEEVKAFVGDIQVYLERRYNEPSMVYSRLKIEAHTLKVVPASDTYLILRTKKGFTKKQKNILKSLGLEDELQTSDNKDCCMDLSSWDDDDNLQKRISLHESNSNGGYPRYLGSFELYIDINFSKNILNKKDWETNQKYLNLAQEVLNN